MNSNTRSVLTDTDHLAPQGLRQGIQLALARYGLLGSLGRYMILKTELRKFIRDTGSRSERVFRRKLLKKFRLIEQKIPCAHSPYQFVLIARNILGLEIDGPIVQCGCFKGGSTAKLSVLAERTNRRLYVCDTFSGLPPPESDDELLLRGHGDVPSLAIMPGQYKGSLEEVRRNVTLYGCVDVCQFVPGVFKESLVELDIRPAFVFIDVDFISSARDCLRHLWPRLAPSGYWFTHEAAFLNYIYGVLDPDWWHNVLGECPPTIIGAGSGLSSISEYLAYFQKPSHRKVVGT